MVIKKSFGGSTISKPGAFSQTKISPDAGSPLTSNDTIMLVGEADAGPSGATEGIQFFSASALSQLIAKYRTGPIVDAAKNCMTPSRTPGIAGAGRIAVYKTNASTQASLALATSFGTLKALEYGADGNRVSAKIELSAEESPELSGSAAITNYVGLNTQTLILRVDGGASQTVTFASPADMTDVITQIEAQTTGITVIDNSDDVLDIRLEARANGHRAGSGRFIEVVGGTALGNLNLSVGASASAEAEAQVRLTVSQPRDAVTESNTVGGQVVLSIGRDDSDSCTAATVQITADSVILTAIGSDNHTLAKSQYPLAKQLVEAISALPGWSCSLSSASLGNVPTADLDRVAATGAFSETGAEPAQIKRDAAAIRDLIADSSVVELAMTATRGLPDALALSNLSGGSKGASLSSSFDAGFSAALAEDVNIIVPLISQDADQDALDGETDPSSGYDVETVHAALDAHLRLRGSIKNRKEAQGAVGYRKAAKADVLNQAAALNSELIQLFAQDVLVIDSSNELTWKKPHVLAAMVSAARLGAEVGEPMTHKFFAVQGAGHFVNPSTGIVEGDMDPLVDFDEIIDAGVSALEPANGSFRLMVDNTTYGIDASFVFNRASVVEAAQYVAKTVRNDAELAFVGRKNSVVDATAIKTRIRTKLRELFNARILSASEDAPEGFREDTFIVTVVGNTAEVQVEIKPVQGLDFVFITFTLGESRTSA